MLMASPALQRGRRPAKAPPGRSQWRCCLPSCMGTAVKARCLVLDKPGFHEPAWQCAHLPVTTSTTKGRFAGMPRKAWAAGWHSLTQVMSNLSSTAAA